MKFGLWIYPWDVVEQDSGTVLSEIQQLGINELNLATNYHALQSFHPHHSERAYFFSEARSYFKPDDRFGSIKPIPYEQMDHDWVKHVVKKATSETDLSVNSWTIGGHNSALGEMHPEETVLNCFDDRLRYLLCPSRRDVQRYLISLVEYLADSYELERIELESFDYFYGTGFGWHHDKYHAELGRLAEFLLGLCFCRSCVDQSGLAVDTVEQIKETCRRTIRRTAEGQLPADIDSMSWLQDNLEVRTYVDSRVATLSDLYSRLADAADDCDLVPYVGLLDIEEAWVHGMNLRKLEDAVDAYTVLAYESDVESVGDRINVAQELTDAELHLGLRAGYPEITDGETLGAMVRKADEEDINRVSFYNYGLIPKRNLQWIKSAIADVDG